MTRAQAAAGFLISAEYRGRFVRDLYADLLKRAAPPSADEVNGWVESGLDLLSLQVAFAASAEYVANG